MKKNKIKIATIKYNMLKLRANYQVPFYLTWLVNQLDGTEETHYIKFLIECSQHYMRVKNYYRLFPKLDVEAKTMIQKQLLSMGYTVKDYNDK